MTKKRLKQYLLRTVHNTKAFIQVGTFFELAKKVPVFVAWSPNSNSKMAQVGDGLILTVQNIKKIKIGTITGTVFHFINFGVTKLLT